MAKSTSASTQESLDSDRFPHGYRKQSVLDEKALREDDTKLVREQRIQTISRSYQVILGSIGEDPSRQGLFYSVFRFYDDFYSIGLLKTPNRAAEVRIRMFES